MIKPDFSKIKIWHITVVAIGVATIIALIVLGINSNKHKDGDVYESEVNKITVREEQVNEYREMIGTDMDIKKTILIMFETDEECRSFITEHGNDKSPEKAGLGRVPVTEDGYYNIVGRQALETVFDTLKDGEYSKEPVEYSGKFCYLKRIENYSPLNDDEAVKDMIREDKMREKATGGEKK